MRARTFSVTAMALAATLLTAPAFADPAPAPAPSDPTTETTPLGLRPSKPLTLDTAPPAMGGAWKLGLFAVLAAGGIWIWKQRAKKTIVDESSQLRVLRRTTIGVRSELLLLELEGQKILIGVTPSSMQTLYLLPDAGTDELPAAETPAERRMATLLESRVAPREEPRDLAARETARAKFVSAAAEDDSILEGQATGLRSIGARR